ncbi:MAG: hypothetical protein M3Z66_10690 [Chloroflexota bacterium]|nr:hypothetical protein [Chloroflexota bacterium]
MRRFALLLLLVPLLSVLPVHAASWKAFHSRQLAFSLRYPPGWHVSESYVPGNRQVVFGYQGRSNYSLTVQLLPVHPARSIGQTLRRVMTYERSTGQVLVSGKGWKSAAIGRYPAMVAVTKPPTEGGVSVAQAIYVTQSRKHVYTIVDVAYAQHAPSSPHNFPSVYRQMLSSLRFQ